MNTVGMECKECDKQVDCEIIEFHEGEDCWMVFTVKCPECGAPINNSGGCVICPTCGYSKCD